MLPVRQFGPVGRVQRIRDSDNGHGLGNFLHHALVRVIPSRPGPVRGNYRGLPAKRGKILGEFNRAEYAGARQRRELIGDHQHLFPVFGAAPPDNRRSPASWFNRRIFRAAV